MVSLGLKECIIFAFLLISSIGLVFTYSELRQQREGRIENSEKLSLITSNTLEEESSGVKQEEELSGDKLPESLTKSSLSRRSSSSAESRHLNEMQRYFANKPRAWLEPCKPDIATEQLRKIILNWSYPTTEKPKSAPGDEMLYSNLAEPYKRSSQQVSAGQSSQNQPTNSELKSRAKRSVLEAKENVLYKSQWKDRSGKKTSLSSFLGNNQTGEKKRHKSRYYYYSMPDSDNTPQPSAPLSIAPTEQAAKQTESGQAHNPNKTQVSKYHHLDKIVDEIVLHRIKIEIRVNLGLKFVSELEEALTKNINITRQRISELSNSTSLSEEQLAKLSTWIPKVDFGKEFNRSTADEIKTLTKLDEQLQHFSVAIEQLNFDKPLYRNYKTLDRMCLRAMCELDMVLGLFKTIAQNQLQLVRAMESSRMINISATFLEASMKHLEPNYVDFFVNQEFKPRAFYVKQIVKSALSYMVAERKERELPGRRLVGREVMPSEERFLPEELERTYRDLSVLTRLKGFVGQQRAVFKELIERVKIEGE